MMYLAKIDPGAFFAVIIFGALIIGGIYVNNHRKDHPEDYEDDDID